MPPVVEIYLNFPTELILTELNLEQMTLQSLFNTLRSKVSFVLSEKTTLKMGEGDKKKIINLIQDIYLEYVMNSYSLAMKGQVNLNGQRI